MARLTISHEGLESLTFYRQYPELGATGSALMSAVYSPDNPLPPRVKEAVRMRAALINECPVCRNARNFEIGVDERFYEHIAQFRDHPEIYSDRERVAMEYAERFALDHLSIDDALFGQLRAHFSERELAALTISIGYFLAFGRLTQVLKLDQVCALPVAV
ncbi:MAG: carboxymuconolactone decarboxylase family protein [Steroidobacteraceae bacterium]